MLVFSKRKIIVISILSFVVIGIAFIFLKPNQQVSEKAQEHLDNLYSLSGRLTPEEKQTYFENAFALEKISVNSEDMPEKELDKIQEHLRKLIIENPDLILSAQEYDQRFGHILGHTHGHPHGEELYQETQKALKEVNAAIAELEASDVPEGVKEGLRSILNHRRSTLLISDSQIDELNNKFIEFLKDDPEVDGVTQHPRTGEYIPTYPNMLRVYRRRTHHPDGTVDDIVTGISKSSDSSKNQAALDAYEVELEAYEAELEMTGTPGTHPDPPNIKGLRFSVEYEDVYLNAEGSVISDKTDQPMDESVSPSTPDEPTPPMEQPKAEETWTEVVDDVFSLQDTLKDIDDLRMQREITVFLEEALGVPFDRFLKMSDAEIEDELRKMFAPTDADIEAELQDLFMPQHPSMSNKTKFESNLQSNLSKYFSQLRTKRAIATINQLGPKEGLQRLKEVDPEVAKQLEVYFQKQEKVN